MELKAESRAESGFPQGTLLPNIRSPGPTRLTVQHPVIACIITRSGHETQPHRSRKGLERGVEGIKIAIGIEDLASPASAECHESWSFQHKDRNPVPGFSSVGSFKPVSYAIIWFIVEVIQLR
jgi:hypothetical protein